MAVSETNARKSKAASNGVEIEGLFDNLSEVHATFACLALRRAGMNEERYAYADHIQNKHRRGEEAHADGSGSGTDDRGDQEDSEDRIANVPDKKLARRRCRRGEEEDEDRQLEGDAESEDHSEEEAGVVVDRDDWM